MRKHLAMIGLPLLLGGCGLPPALSVASWAIDGISYMASGKSVTDHAISEVMQQDCALFRAVQERAICAGEIEDGPQVAAAAYGDSWQGDDITVQAQNPVAVPVDVAGITASFATDFAAGLGPDAFATPADQASGASTAIAASWSPAPALTTRGRFDGAAPKDRPAYFNTPVYTVAAVPPPAPATRDLVHTVSVVGSFQSADNARKLAGRFAALGSEVRTMQVDGRTWHRVVVDAPLSKVQRMGAVDAWALRVCRTGSTLPPCGTTDTRHAHAGLPQVAQLN